MMAPLGIKGNQRELHKLGSHALKQFLYKSGVIGAFIKARCTCQHGAWAAFFFEGDSYLSRSLLSNTLVNLSGNSCFPRSLLSDIVFAFFCFVLPAD